MHFTRKQIIISVTGALALLIAIAWSTTYSGKSDIALYDGPPSARDSASPNSYNKDMMVSEAEAPMMAQGLTKTYTVPPSEPSGTADIEEVTRQDRLIIKTALLSVVSKDVAASAKELTEYAQAAGGFVVSVDIEDLENTPSATVTMRIPVEQFDAAITKARESGIRVVSESIDGQDITEEYVDTAARLKSLEASEQQFMEIMKQAKNVEEILQVQSQLESVRSRIEQAKGRMQYMERSAKLSTITVYLSADAKELPVVNPSDKWQPLAVIKEASRSFLGLLKSLGNLIIWIAVFIPIWVPLLLILRWLKKRRVKTRVTQPVPSVINKPSKPRR